MKILVIGGGGREHALVWKIAQSSKVKKIFAAPGNAGMDKLATCLPIKANEIDKLLKVALKEKIDLTVVGPEDPLAEGIVDKFEAKGLKVFGASKAAAQLEASKTFSKNLMIKYGIPTAKGETFTSFAKAKKYLEQQEMPIVVKADGLAAGKGVLICNTQKEALAGLKQILQEKAFGDAGKKVVIEEFLVGEEVSFLALTDGKTVLPLPSSQDHKRIFDNDEGPNTGGMGAYSPAPVLDRYLHDKAMKEVIIPTVEGMAKEGIPYKGILYAGLMIDKDKIKVLEFNARFGDPEAQPLMMRIKSDIVPVLEASIDGTLDRHKLEIDERATVCVVMSSKGYPGAYKVGHKIQGIDEANKLKDAHVFHAGTAFNKKKEVVTSGGRVLGVTALGDTIEKAIKKAYQATSKIKWNGAFQRKDIGQKALDRLNKPAEVGIIMGSDSDLPTMMPVVAILKKFDIKYEMIVASAHRTPEIAQRFASDAIDKGMKVIIAGAGHAAHLAGAMAAHTTLPIIGIPIDSSALNGFDALLSTVQMPPGVPVATVAVGKPGATNAGVLAAQIIATADPKVRELLNEHKLEMTRKVEEKSKEIGRLL
jgi:phosphoribosylamine--glycine ligase